MWRWTAVLLAVAVTIPALAFSNEVQEGSARAPNESVDLIGGVDLGFRNAIYVDSLGRMRVIPMGYNGSSWDSLRVDASGILRVVNEYPNNLQTVATTLATNEGTSVGAYRLLGNSFTAHPYGKSALYVHRSNLTTPGATGEIMLYLMSSDDNLNFYPASAGGVWSSGSAGIGATVTDTLRVAVGIADVVIPLPEDTYMGRYVQVWGYETIDTVADSLVTIIHWGRYD